MWIFWWVIMLKELKVCTFNLENLCVLIENQDERGFNKIDEQQRRIILLYI